MNSLAENDISMINHLFDALAGIRPAFKQAWPTQNELDNAKYQWSRALIDEGITTDTQIKRGLKRCRAMEGDFISSPGEFIKLCKPTPEDIGAPSIDLAFKNALHNASKYTTEKRWLHPAVKYACDKIGYANISNGKEEHIKPIFKRYYLETCSAIDETTNPRVSFTQEPSDNPYEESKRIKLESKEFSQEAYDKLRISMKADYLARTKYAHVHSFSQLKETVTPMLAKMEERNKWIKGK